MTATLSTSAGLLRLSGLENTSWSVKLTSSGCMRGIEEITLELSSPEAAVPPRFTLFWEFPHTDLAIRFSPASGFAKNVPADWCGTISSDLAHHAPFVTLLSLSGENRLTFAFSDALRHTECKAGFIEENNRIDCRISGFLQPEAPLAFYEAVLRLDTRKIFYADAIRATTDWFASRPEYRPCAVPECALRPLYSTWYSYHQNLSAAEIEQECALAAAFGMSGVIVDDGCQTWDNHRGYAWCGDWKPARKRFPDIRAHVKRVHQKGMKSLFWFAVPFAGIRSAAFERFRGKFLFVNEQLGTAVLDPRFPDVRRYLVDIYRRAACEWRLDGLKLDFIDSFALPPETADPALADNFAGRDCRTVAEGVDRLLSDVTESLRAANPDVMIEFRQSYTGPAIRKYGNIFRAADCPGDFLSNRVRTIDLRLTSGATAVHSDMITWNYGDSTESAARQILNVLFSVPQISVRLAGIPEDHAAMLRFWLKLWTDNRDTLMRGRLIPLHPELNYPQVSAEDRGRRITVLYAPRAGLSLDIRPGKSYCIINASEEETVFLDLHGENRKAEYFTASGVSRGISDLRTGLSSVKIPLSGLLEF